MKKKRLSTRKRTALRRILIGVAALVLVNHFLQIGLLFPFQALRRCEERQGTGRTKVVCRTWPRDVFWDRLVYLSENEEATMLSELSLEPLGWNDQTAQVLDCTKEMPLYAGWMSIGDGKGAFVLYVFGRVDDPDIAQLEIQVQYEEWETVGGARHTALTWDSGRRDWMEKDGRYYFLFRTYPPFDWSGYHSNVYPLAVGYDETGKETARLDVTGCMFGDEG